MDALGRLREFLGDRVPQAVLRLEIFSRMLGFAREASQVVAGLSDQDRAFLEAYAHGVNLATAREPRPVEFRRLRYVPQPWTPLDSVAITETVSFGFCKDWEQELTRLELMVNQLETGSTLERALAIWPARIDLPPHLIGEKPAVDPFASIPPIAPELAQWLLATYSADAPVAPKHAAIEKDGTDRTDGPLARALDLQFLSNNWAMSGKWTGTGKGAFAVDPHMPTSLPPLPYVMSLTLDSRDEGSFTAVGAGFPGLPALPFGTNGKVAWGPTSNWADCTDLFVERTVAGKSDLYLGERGTAVRGETRDFPHQARNGYRQETRTVRSTRHGVIVNDFIDRLPADFPLVALPGPQRRRFPGKHAQALSGGNGERGAGRPAGLHRHSRQLGARRLERQHRLCRSPEPARSPSFTGNRPGAGLDGHLRMGRARARGPAPLDRESPAGIPGHGQQPGGGPGLDRLSLQLRRRRSPQGDTHPRRALRRQAPRPPGGPDAPAPDQRPGQQLPRGQGPGPAGPGAACRRAKHPRHGGAHAPFLGWGCGPFLTGFDAVPVAAHRAHGHAAGGRVHTATLDYLHFYFNTDPLLFGILGDPSNPAWENRRTRQAEDTEKVVSQAFGETVARLARAYGQDVQSWTWRRAAPFTLAHPLGSVPGFWSSNRSGIPPRGTASSLFMHKYSRSDPVRFPVIYGPALRLVVDFADMEHSFISIPGGESSRPAPAATTTSSHCSRRERRSHW